VQVRRDTLRSPDSNRTSCPRLLHADSGTRQFLKAWLRALVRGATPLTIREEADLDHALMGTLALDLSARRLSRLIGALGLRPTVALGQGRQWNNAQQPIAVGSGRVEAHPGSERQGKCSVPGHFGIGHRGSIHQE
jgi:hypothetical protein